MHQKAPRDAVNVMKPNLHLLKTCCVSLEIRQVIFFTPKSWHLVNYLKF